MLSYTDLKPGIKFVLDDEPFQVLNFNLLKLQRSKPVAQTKIRNLRTGKVLDRNFRQSDKFEEVEINVQDAIYIYNRNDEYWFHEKGQAGNRFSMPISVIGNTGNFLKENDEVSILKFKDSLIGIDMPIKKDFKVREAPPSIKGDTAQGGSKEVIIETGFKLNVPLFIEEGDTIRINTDTGEYAERIKKSG